MKQNTFVFKCEEIFSTIGGLYCLKLTVVLWKMVINMLGKKSTRENRKTTTMGQSWAKLKNDLLKAVGPNGTEITMVSWKAGSRQWRSPGESVPRKVNFWAENVVQKVPFWKSRKSKIAPKSYLSMELVRRWDPFKAVSGSGFEKSWKNNELLIWK